MSVFVSTCILKNLMVLKSRTSEVYKEAIHVVRAIKKQNKKKKEYILSMLKTKNQKKTVSCVLDFIAGSCF